MSTSIADLGELALIDRLRQRVGPAPSHVEIGIGDDAATIAGEPGSVSVVTTDALVEGVHFRRDWTAARAIGHKSLAVNLSDLAAMGAAPRASLLSLALPETFPLDDFDALVDGYVALASASGAALVGGNLTGSPGPVVVNVTAIGAVRRRRVLRRDTARAGHELYVTGVVGAAAAGLALLAAGIHRGAMDAAARAAVARYEQPDARWRLGWMVGRSGSASAAMDLSDGLAATARALADASGVGVVLDADAIPVAEAARAWAVSAGRDLLSFVLAGGEDYELAFAVSPRSRRQFLAAAGRARGLQVTRIGRFVSDRGAWLAQGDALSALPGGFEHWGRSPFPQNRPESGQSAIVRRP
jgi:thiamine-monophosphate kinase